MTMHRSILWKPAMIVLLLLAVSSALADPQLFRRKCRTQEPVDVYAGAAPPKQPKAVTRPQPIIPESLEPPEDYVLLFEFRAEGVQIYECKAKKNSPNEFEWVLTAPDATLFDDRGEKAGTHTAGPTWEAKDGSRIVAVKKASFIAPGGRAIPWLLLGVKSHKGTGVFSNVEFIQRVDTWAGLPPVDGATKENDGKQVRVKYEATYRFYAIKR
jgi:hypothetical protein